MLHCILGDFITFVNAAYYFICYYYVKAKKMKKLIFIILVLVIFVAYCFGSASNFSYIEIPQYVDKNINVLGELSMQEWESDKAARDDRLKELVRADYQPPSTGFHFGKGRSYDRTYALSAEDYVQIVKNEPKLSLDLPVRDSSEVLALAGMGYTIRDDVIGPKGETIASAGEVLDKKILDKLDSLGITRIRVVGLGGVVSIESGTMLMVPLIFLALLAALKLIMFDPLIKIMDERSEEIDDGTEQAKLNRVEVAKLAKESKDKFDQVRREHLFALGKAKHEIKIQSETVIHEANEEALKAREEAHKELQKTLTGVEQELRGRVDELAQDIVAQVIKGGNA